MRRSCSTFLHYWIKNIIIIIKTAASREHRSRFLKILILCQIVTSFLIIIVSLLNLSLSSHNKALWSTLVGVGFGYLVSNPRLKRASSSNEDEQIHDFIADQQLDEPLPRQHGVTMENETE